MKKKNIREQSQGRWPKLAKEILHSTEHHAQDKNWGTNTEEGLMGMQGQGLASVSRRWAMVLHITFLLLIFFLIIITITISFTFVSVI